jgi:threonine dehydrogenase-like Zn-dependent dehydrogenase
MKNESALLDAAPPELRDLLTMKALVFHGPNDIRLERVPIPTPGYGEAVLRVTLTTICGTDLHIVRGEYPVEPGLGADVVLNPNTFDVVEEILRLTNRRGVDVAIEALGTQQTFENALRVLAPAGTLSSLGVYSGKLTIPLEPFQSGLGDKRIVTTLCPGGKERMRRLMELVLRGRVDLRPLLTHTFRLDQILDAYKLFGERRDGVIKVAIKPQQQEGLLN